LGWELRVSIVDWLTSLGLQEHADTFAREGIDDLDLVRELEESDLEKLGLKMGHRKRLLKALRDPVAGAGGSASAHSSASGGMMTDAEQSPCASAVQSSAFGQQPGTPSGHPFPGAAVAAVRSLRLFLSYGRDEYVEEARALRDALRQRGHEVWFDEERLAGGLDWEQRIEKGLAGCDRVVLAMTPHSVRRPDGYCLNEIAKALELRKLIIPVLMVDIPQGAPTSICRIQYLDWRDAVPARERAERFSRRLQRLCEAIEEDKLDFEGGQQRLMRHLQPLNYDGDIQHHVARFRGRRQLEARLRAWMESPSASQRLWLTAAPGLGKSAVAAALAHRWGETGAVHFCVAGHHDKADPARAILSIAYQLATHLDLYRLRLASLDLERETEKDARTLFDTLLVGPLARDFPAPDKPWLVILDGLDEATQPDGANALAEVVASGWGRLPPWIRLLVSSRPEAEVQQWLAGTPTVELRGDDVEQRLDLAEFVRERLTVAGKPPSEVALQSIVQRSEGAFHYVVLLVEEVLSGRCDPENPVELPAGLNQIYLQAFRRRFPDPRRYREDFRPLLDLMLASPEPLPLAVMAGAVGRSVGDVRQGLAQLGAMLVIERGHEEIDPNWDTVRASHASLRTWLTGLDESTRLPLAGVFAAAPNVQRLAHQVLDLWDAVGPSGSEQGVTGTQPKAFVARVLWGLLKTVGDNQSMARVASALSAHWSTRRLAWAIEPAEFAAEQARRLLLPLEPDADVLGRALMCEAHLARLYQSLGRTAQSLEHRHAQLELARRRSAVDPGHLDWQRDLASAQTQLGEALEALGDLDAALDMTQLGVAALERLFETDPSRIDHLQRLADGLTKAGVIRQLKGDFEGALQAYQRNLSIVERLVASDPDHLGWMFDLGRGHGLIGGVLFAQGDLEGALPRHRAYALAFEQLSARDPGNAEWLQDLGFSHHHVGAVLESMGDLDSALKEQQIYCGVAQRLCEKDPDHAAWQSDLALSCARITSILITQAKLPEAHEAGSQALMLFRQLSDRDPANAFARREFAVSQANVAQILWQMGQAQQAQSACEDSIPQFDTLRRAGTPSSLIDWGAIHALAAQITEGLGDAQALARHEAELAGTDLPPQGVTGPFRQRLAPLILQRLGRLIEKSEHDQKAALVLRALRLAPRAPGVDVEHWRSLARTLWQDLPSACRDLQSAAELAAELATASPRA